MKIIVFHLDTHSLPRTLQDLITPAGFSNWKGPYGKYHDILNIWGQPFGYEAIDSAQPEFRLFTASPDGVRSISEVYEPQIE